MPDGLQIVSEPSASADDIAYVKNALYQFNMTTMDDHNPRPINLFVRDSANVIYAGLLANCWGKWVHIDFLWVGEMLRKQGYGTRMLEMAETKAREFGCEGSYLETFTFQARPFYERFGYRVVGQVDNFPPGQTYYFMSKIL